MRRGWSVVVLGVLVLLAGLVGWRIVTTALSAHWLAEEPERALAWNPAEPAARLAHARASLDAGESAAAALQARRVLQAEPLQAEGLVLLARVADAEHDPRVSELFRRALQRSPRDQYARAWMIDELLRTGHYDEAIVHVNVLLGFAPWLQEILLPTLAEASSDREFAASLSRALSGHPGWRSALLDDLLARGDPGVIETVYGSLLTRHELSDREARRWFDWLGRAGRWGEAYSHWVSWLQLPAGAGVSLVDDGGFDHSARGLGFGWRMQGGANALIERVREADNTVVRVTFLGRRTSWIGLAQNLFLAPGRYHLQFRAAARDVRSDRGIHWVIACHGGSPMRVETEALQGSFDWKVVERVFEIPSRDCPAQELALVNPGSAGAGKMVSGTLWLDDFVIVPIPAGSDAPAPDPGAPAEKSLY